MKEGRKEGRKEGKKEGKKEGRKEGRMDGWVPKRKQTQKNAMDLPTRKKCRVTSPDFPDISGQQ